MGVVAGKLLHVLLVFRQIIRLSMKYQINISKNMLDFFSADGDKGELVGDGFFRQLQENGRTFGPS